MRDDTPNGRFLALGVVSVVEEWEVITKSLAVKNGRSWFV